MLIIFDWDGTLLDSTGKIIGCMREAAGRLNLPLPDEEAVRNIIGLGLGEGILMLYPSFTESDVAELKEMYSKCFVAADQRPCEFYPNVLATLERLQEGHSLAVATGKSRRGLSRVLGNLAMERNFVATRCADETASKPDPLMLKELLAETGFSAAEAVMVGDTEYDLEMAQRAGMASIGVAYGAHAVERLAKWDPVAILQNFDEIEAVLAQLSNAQVQFA